LKVWDFGFEILVFFEKYWMGLLFGWNGFGEFFVFILKVVKLVSELGDFCETVFLEGLELLDKILSLLQAFGDVFFDGLLLLVHEGNFVFKGIILLFEFRILVDEFLFELLIRWFCLFKFWHEIVDVLIFEQDSFLKNFIGYIWGVAWWVVTGKRVIFLFAHFNILNFMIALAQFL
jgi:hypothetical protein